MNKSVMVGLSTFAMVAGLATIPVASLAWDHTEKHDLKAAKESLTDSIQILKKALDEAREHNDDKNYCNYIQQAIDAAYAARESVKDDLQDDSY